MSKSKLFSPARKEAGFTLIELLTVIVIIGILAAIAIPVFTSQRARAQDSQTISDVRNIAVQAETIMSDPKSTYDDVTKANIDFASSKNVSWNISGKASLGGYCIVAKNTAGKKYTTDATALTYDSLAGGVGQSGKACNATTNPVAPSGSTGVGSLVAVSVAAPTNVSVNRGSQTSATVSWTIPTDTTVTGYVLQRSATTNDTDFVTVGTITSRTTSTFTDTSAPSTAAYYRLMSTTAAGTSSVKSNVASLTQYTFVPVTSEFNATRGGVGRDGDVQTFTVSANGTYKIEAWGAQGGSGQNYSGVFSTGGKGAYAAGTFTLNSGQSLSVYVANAGVAGYSDPAGGGASGVSLNSAPLVIAGGGGGAAGQFGGVPGSTTDMPNVNGASNTSVTLSGYGGIGNRGAGGAGANGNGADGDYASGGGLMAAFNGTGGYGPNGGNGGWGYAGGGAGGGWGAGGGGGYTGGSGSPTSNTGNSAAQGGGSYVSSVYGGTNFETNNTTKAQTGAGKIIITRIS